MSMRFTTLKRSAEFKRVRGGTQGRHALDLAGGELALEARSERGRGQRRLGERRQRRPGVLGVARQVVVVRAHRGPAVTVMSVSNRFMQQLSQRIERA